MDTPTRRDFIHAGRYFYMCDPDGFANWARNEGTRSLERAGQYFYMCDPDGFARWIADSNGVMA